MYRSLVLIALRLVGPSVVLSLAGCFPSPGPCDENGALELVYTPEGIPAFAGQAVTQLSCGNGGFCHSESIPPADRFGAPAGLDFDVGIAATTAARCTDPACVLLSTEELRACCANSSQPPGARLARNQDRVLNNPGKILGQIASGSMPPSGDVFDHYRCQITPTADGCDMSGVDQVYDRIADDGTSSRLPTLLDEDPGVRREAQEILRNWLACGAPVVERTVAHADNVPNFAGFTVRACERLCVDVTWPAIYGQIIEPSCTTSACHDGTDPGGELDLITSSGAHAELLLRAEGPDCTGGADPPFRVVPGNPESSMLVDKLEAGSGSDVCGAPMPQSRPLSAQQLCAIRQWILLGACEDPAACPAATPEALTEARAACNFDAASATGQCAVVPASGCRNHL